MVEVTVNIPDNVVSCTIPGVGWGLGPYGAAVDNEGNLRFYVWSLLGRMINVDYETLQYEVFNGGSYGITVDSQGRPWNDVPRPLDPLSGVWASPIGNLPGSGGSGVAE